jgi:hypothetical protein
MKKFGAIKETRIAVNNVDFHWDVGIFVNEYVILKGNALPLLKNC